jgi:hypothetical protein
LQRLQPLLDDLGISSTLARVHYLGLPGRDGSEISTAYEQRQPILFVPLPSGKVLRIRASGQSYVLVTGMSFQADDPQTAAREIALFASAG